MEREEPHQPDHSHLTADKIERARQMVESGFQDLVAELKQGKSERFMRYLDFCARFHQYSALNLMLIFSQRPNATFVAGYRRWQELGYQVRNGEKGIAILAPIVYVRKNTGEDGEVNEQERMVGFKVVHVFDASQLVNTPEKPLPTFWDRLPDDKEEVYTLVKSAVEACGIEVQEGKLRLGAQGVSKGGRIVLAEGRDSRSRTMTLIHEWAHEILHRQWLNEEERRRVPRATRECQAEAVSYVVSRYLGLEHPFARDYLLSYGNTAEDLSTNLDQVQEASHFMIIRLEEVMRGE